jgi:type VI secretion system lysozyme-like protein
MVSNAKIEVRRPLFDRLVDVDPSGEELTPMRTLDRRGLKQSVRRELQTLFNTRCPFPARWLSGRQRTVIDYGIPDFSHLSPRNFHDVRRIEALLRAAVEAFEPRLSAVRVTLRPVTDNERELVGTLEAQLIVDKVSEPVSFATAVNSQEGTVRVDAAE